MHGYRGWKLGFGLAFWATIAAAQAPGEGYHWLRLEQRGERQQLQAEQDRYRRQRAGESGAAALETERRLQRERLEQDALFDLQRQEQLRLQGQQRPLADDNAVQRQQLQRQRLEQQNRQLQLHRDLQRRTRPGGW